MSDSALKRQIRERLDTLQVEDNSIVVLKGIPIAVVDPDNSSQVDFEKAVSNKLAYFFGITTSNRKFLTYEEFLLMSDFILSQYKTVYILVNNIYMNQYPLDMFYSCFILTQQGQDFSPISWKLMTTATMMMLLVTSKSS